MGEPDDFMQLYALLHLHISGLRPQAVETGRLPGGGWLPGHTPRSTPGAHPRVDSLGTPQGRPRLKAVAHGDGEGPGMLRCCYDLLGTIGGLQVYSVCSRTAIMGLCARRKVVRCRELGLLPPLVVAVPMLLLLVLLLGELVVVEDGKEVLELARCSDAKAL